MQLFIANIAHSIKTNTMRTFLVLLILLTIYGISHGQTVEHTWRFPSYTIENVGNDHLLILNGSQQYGAPGNPLLPYVPVSLLLPPGESATSVDIIMSGEVEIEGSYQLYPSQAAIPYSATTVNPVQKNEEVYSSTVFPLSNHSKLSTQYLNGFSIATFVFTPVNYNPATGKLSYYSQVTIKIHSQKSAQGTEALKNLSAADNVLQRVRFFVQNPDMIDNYPLENNRQAYQLLIITPSSLESGFDSLVDYYTSVGISSQVTSVESIYAGTSGADHQEKIRNYIKSEYQTNSIEYVILGGDTELIPSRGFYCYVNSGSGYADDSIPADLYYSGLDGDFNFDSDSHFGEIADSSDLLPELAVGRFPVSNMQELQNMVHKSIWYQKYPVQADMNKPLFLGELLLESPLTLGQDYLNLLIDDHNDNGYTTSGIPSATNTIDSLYDYWIDPPGYAVEWSTLDMITKVNNGSSFIHHVGHSSETYMMKMQDFVLNEYTFSNLDGITHSYGLLYTHGCLCGAFDYDDCIAETSVTLSNFLAAAVCNSRYGWFNEGYTEGPSQHLHREFVNAIYNPSLNLYNLGDAFVMSKIATAPWVDLPGEYEPGAQRWVHYDNNILGDPVLRIWVDGTQTSVANETTIQPNIYPNPSNGIFTLELELDADIRVLSVDGKCVYSASPKAGTHVLDLSQLSAGVYLLEVFSDFESSTTKLIIK